MTDKTLHKISSAYNWEPINSRTGDRLCKCHVHGRGLDGIHNFVMLHKGIELDLTYASSGVFLSSNAPRSCCIVAASLHDAVFKHGSFAVISIRMLQVCLKYFIYLTIHILIAMWPDSCCPVDLSARRPYKINYIFKDPGKGKASVYWVCRESCSAKAKTDEISHINLRFTYLLTDGQDFVDFQSLGELN